MNFPYWDPVRSHGKAQSATDMPDVLESSGNDPVRSEQSPGYSDNHNSCDPTDGHINGNNMGCPSGEEAASEPGQVSAAAAATDDPPMRVASDGGGEGCEVEEEGSIEDDLKTAREKNDELMRKCAELEKEKDQLKQKLRLSEAATREEWARKYAGCNCPVEEVDEDEVLSGNNQVQIRGRTALAKVASEDSGNDLASMQNPDRMFQNEHNYSAHNDSLQDSFDQTEASQFDRDRQEALHDVRSQAAGRGGGDVGNQMRARGAGSMQPLQKQQRPLPPRLSNLNPSEVSLYPDTQPPADMVMASTSKKKRGMSGDKRTDSGHVKRPKRGGGNGRNKGASGSKGIQVDEQEQAVEAGGAQFKCEDGLMLLSEEALQIVIKNRAQVQAAEHPLEHPLDIEDEKKHIKVMTGMYSDSMCYKPNLSHAKQCGLIDKKKFRDHGVNGRSELRSEWTGKKARISVDGLPTPTHDTTKEDATLLVAGLPKAHKGSLKYFTKDPDEIEVWNETEGKVVLLPRCPGFDLITGDPCNFVQTTSNLIDHHRSKHTLRFSHYCKACGEGRMTLDAMMIHLCRDHFGMKNKVVECRYCKKEFYFDYECDEHEHNCKLQPQPPGGAKRGGRGGRGSGRGRGGGGAGRKTENNYAEFEGDGEAIAEGQMMDEEGVMEDQEPQPPGGAKRGGRGGRGRGRGGGRR